jgi:hypothetical protein
MQIITPADFKEWKNSQVTIAFMNSLLERIEDTKDFLVGCPLEDVVKHQGYIMAIKDIMQLDFAGEQ